jgi:hypothetical protein
MRTLALLAVLLAAQPLSAAHARSPAGPPNVLTVRRPAGPEWFGLYLMGKKAGWSSMEVRREQRQGVDVLVARSETALRATLSMPGSEGKSVERQQIDEKVYQARPGGRLLSFRSERRGDGGARTVEGTCTQKGCTARLTAEGSPPKTLTLPPIAETAEQADAPRLAAALRSTVRGEQLELEQLRAKKMPDVYKGRGTLVGGGTEVAVSTIAESEEGDRVPALVSVADDGRLVEIRFGEALVAKPEAEATARRLDKIDLFALSRAELPSSLPRDVPGAITFRLKGLPPSFRVNDDRQSFTDVGGDALLTVRAVQPAAADPTRDAPRDRKVAPDDRKLLDPTPEIDSDQPEIQQLALQATEGTPGVYGASVKLMRLVYGRLKKAYGVSHDRASEVLRAGQGDCTEHSLLFLALARAAGIPCRGVHGLVYARYDDQVPALYWHAWVEVKSGNEWIWGAGPRSTPSASSAGSRWSPPRPRRSPPEPGARVLRAGARASQAPRNLDPAARRVLKEPDFLGPGGRDRAPTSAR